MSVLKEQKISMRKMAEVAGVTTQTIINSVRLLEPFQQELEEIEKKNPKI